MPFDLAEEERPIWEKERLLEPLELDDEDIDPAPFQLTRKTSLFRVCYDCSGDDLFSDPYNFFHASISEGVRDRLREACGSCDIDRCMTFHVDNFIFYNFSFVKLSKNQKQKLRKNQIHHLLRLCGSLLAHPRLWTSSHRRWRLSDRRLRLL